MKKTDMPKIKSVVKDERFDWIITSADDEIDDGVLINEIQYEKFKKEANSTGYTIFDYVDFMEECCKKFDKDNGELIKRNEYLCVIIEGLEKQLKEQNQKTFIQRLLGK